MNRYYDVIVPREAEGVLIFAINGGQSLLRYGAEDSGQILSWINLADLSLEVVPSCRESLNSCLDWFGTNRERVEVALAILADAQQKVHSPRHASLLKPSRAYRMLMEKVCDGQIVAAAHYDSSHA